MTSQAERRFAFQELARLKLLSERDASEPPDTYFGRLRTGGNSSALGVLLQPQLAAWNQLVPAADQNKSVAPMDVGPVQRANVTVGIAQERVRPTVSDFTLAMSEGGVFLVIPPAILGVALLGVSAIVQSPVCLAIACGCGAVAGGILLLSVLSGMSRSTK